MEQKLASVYVKVNLSNYIKLRHLLLDRHMTFRAWLEEKVEEEVNK